MTDSTTAAATAVGDHTTPTPWTGVRFQPSVALGLLVYAGYLAIFYATWKINDVDYDTIGDTVESTKLHYAMPTLLGCAFLIVAISVLGWWRITLFDTFRSGPTWAWIGPIAMFGLAVVSFAGSPGPTRARSCSSGRCSARSGSASARR